jgi:hypothetical protein
MASPCIAAWEFPYVSVNFKNIFEASLDDFSLPRCLTRFEGIDKPCEGGSLQPVQFCPVLARGISMKISKNQ